MYNIKDIENHKVNDVSLNDNDYEKNVTKFKYTMKDTVNDMLSTSHAKHLVAEYMQLDIRIKVLEKKIEKYAKCVLMFSPKVPIAVYLDMLNSMKTYQTALKTVIFMELYPEQYKKLDIGTSYDFEDENDETPQGIFVSQSLGGVSHQS